MCQSQVAQQKPLAPPCLWWLALITPGGFIKSIAQSRPAIGPRVLVRSNHSRLKQSCPPAASAPGASTTAQFFLFSFSEGLVLACPWWPGQPASQARQYWQARVTCPWRRVTASHPAPSLTSRPVANDRVCPARSTAILGGGFPFLFLLINPVTR